MVVLLCEHFEQFAPYDVVANGCLDDQHCKHFVPCSRMFLDVWTTMNIWPALGPWSELRVRMRQDVRALSRLPQLHLPIALDRTRTKNWEHLVWTCSSPFLLFLVAMQFNVRFTHENTYPFLFLLLAFPTLDSSISCTQPFTRFYHFLGHWSLFYLNHSQFWYVATRF